jgi:membrane protease YdiL (CAAX protease family)
MTDELLPAGDQPQSILRLGLIFEGAIALGACAIGIFLPTPPWKLIEWRAGVAAWGLVATIPLVVGLLILRQINLGPFRRLNAVVDEMLVPLFARCTIVQLAILSVLAGVGEELMFRGVLQPVLIGWLGVVIGIVLASTVFGLLHAVTVTYAVLATGVGAYLGWLTIASENLLVPIIAHSLYDFVALVYLIQTRPGKKVDLRAAVDAAHGTAEQTGGPFLREP